MFWSDAGVVEAAEMLCVSWICPFLLLQKIGDGAVENAGGEPQTQGCAVAVRVRSLACSLNSVASSRPRL